MSRLETWIKKQSPEAAKGMTALKNVDCLHISNNPRLSNLVPRIGNRQMAKEDRTIPRISCAETLTGCIYGYAAVRSDAVNDTYFDGNDWMERKSPVMHIYRMNVEEVVRPSKKLVPDAVRTGEIWVVPYSPETTVVNPEKIGQLFLKKTVDIREAGNHYVKNTFLLHVKKPLVLDDKLLSEGYYQFDLNGLLATEMGGDVERPENIKVITGIDYKEYLKKASKG